MLDVVSLRVKEDGNAGGGPQQEREGKLHVGEPGHAPTVASVG